MQYHVYTSEELGVSNMLYHVYTSEKLGVSYMLYHVYTIAYLKNAIFLFSKKNTCQEIGAAIITCAAELCLRWERVQTLNTFTNTFEILIFKHDVKVTL